MFKTHWIYHAVNVIVILCLVIVSRRFDQYFRVTPFSLDFLRFLAFIFPLILIPVAMFIQWARNRHREERRPLGLKIYLVATRLFFAVIWLFFLMPVLLIGCVYLDYHQPWPISLRQGPDTSYAREMFQKYFHMESSAAIDHLYCKSYWLGWGDGNAYLFKMHYNDKEVITQIAQKGYLEPYPLEKWPDLNKHKRTANDGVPYPSWWPQAGEMKFQEVYARKVPQYDGSLNIVGHDYDPLMFVDLENRMIYYGGGL